MKQEVPILAGCWHQPWLNHHKWVLFSFETEKYRHKLEYEHGDAYGVSGVCKTEEHKDMKAETAWRSFQRKIQI